MVCSEIQFFLGIALERVILDSNSIAVLLLGDMIGWDEQYKSPIQQKDYQRVRLK